MNSAHPVGEVVTGSYDPRVLFAHVLSLQLCTFECDCACTTPPILQWEQYCIQQPGSEICISPNIATTATSILSNWYRFRVSSSTIMVATARREFKARRSLVLRPTNASQGSGNLEVSLESIRLCRLYFFCSVGVLGIQSGRMHSCYESSRNRISKTGPVLIVRSFQCKRHPDCRKRYASSRPRWYIPSMPPPER